MSVPSVTSGTEGNGGERAVSPVVGVVVLLGVTVVLGLTIGPFVLGTVGNLGSTAPDGEFSFFYEESVDPDRTDDFGTSVTTGDGLMSIKMERGATLDPANVEIQTTTAEWNLLEDTDDAVYGSDDRVRPGDNITVVASRGETVRVVWRESGGGQSAVLASLTVPAMGADVPPGVPRPTLDCEWVESHTGNGDFEVRQGDEFEAGDVVGCGSLGEIVDGDFLVDGDLTVVGDIDSERVALVDDEFDSGGDVYGEVRAEDNLELSALTVTESVVSGGILDIQEVTVQDDIEAGLEADIAESTVDGGVVTDSLTLDDSTVTGHADVDSLDCQGSSTINGEDCEEYKEALFDVSITATTWPGEVGETFRAEVVAENVRIEDGDREVSLLVDGDEVDETEVSDLGRGESELVVLEWVPGEAGEYVVTVDTDESDRDELDSQAVSIPSDHSEFPTVETFDVTTDDSSISVDWSVSGGDANLSVVEVVVDDASGEEVAEEVWFYDDDQADESVTFEDLAAETHSVKLEVSDQDGRFVREIETAEPG